MMEKKAGGCKYNLNKKSKKGSKKIENLYFANQPKLKQRAWLTISRLYTNTI